MQTFQTTIQVTTDDLDDLNHVNNVRYVKWVEDVAKLHWFTNAPKEITDSFLWIMLSHHITYKKPAFLDDLITLKTYVPNSEGVKCTRIVEILNGETLLAKSETKWVYMDSNRMRPTRITEDIKNIFL
ncbi:acyl-CoA thioesterase [Bizionia argentinensis JUB59]|uniref:Acyl-CoA thioesterase n=1 Tax=Bizionia argentinensis JUB59 TaxID=1046627 RepID=G2EFM3_9FLAO|nr:thioesterase family protein [Bizionia argentinensis]EGV42766.1 acyl-CoA thioesterase [Bizionia argentinensis JUB59]